MIKIGAVLLSIVLALGFSSRIWAQSATLQALPTPANSEGVSYGTVLNLHGKIVSVNTVDKQVTLEGPEGRKVVINVMNPYNLQAAKVGEPVVARYYEIITIRKKKPGENVQSGTLAAGVSTAKPGEVPGGTAEEQGYLLVTVEAIDQANGTVTVKATDGSTQTVKARGPENLKRLTVGDELVIGIYRAVAIALDKEGP